MNKKIIIGIVIVVVVGLALVCLSKCTKAKAEVKPVTAVVTVET